MKKFIAYFDYLGFKQFIDNNDIDYQRRIVGNNLRDIENALAKEKLKRTSRGSVVADLSQSRINCINFSDTVVFWTNDDSEESLKDILEVAHIFNWHVIDYFFPARGSLVYGEIEVVDFQQKNEAGGRYNISSPFGKGLVRAHEKAEMQHWAGTVLDSSLTEEIVRRNYDIETFLQPYAKRYKVPYKKNLELPDEYVLCLVTGQLNDEAFKNYSKNVRENFAKHKKSVDNDDVRKKIENTIQFLQSFMPNSDNK